MQQLSTSGTIELLPHEEWEGIIDEPSAKGYLWQARLMGAVATVSLLSHEAKRYQTVTPFDQSDQLDPLGPTYPLRIVVKGHNPGSGLLHLTLRKPWDDHIVQRLEIPVVVLPHR